MSKKDSGFTLIELLVVVAIIGLLSSVVLASLNTARAKSRDARRLADIKEIQKALELYYYDYRQYPPSTDQFQTVTGSLGTVLSPAYIAKVPQDPTRSDPSGYRYSTDSTTDAQAYTILIALEKDNAWCVAATTGQDVQQWYASYGVCK